MGTILMKKVCNDAQTLIQDKTGVRWDLADLLSFGNMGQREVAIYRPEASTRTQPRLLTPNATKQTLPVDGVRLIRLVRNMGSDGATPGDAITITDVEQLDAGRPAWHSEANAYGKVIHYTYDPADPRTYFVWPKAPATSLYVEESMYVVPADCQINGVAGGTADTPIAIDDLFANALTDYIAYRAYMIDAEHAANAALAAAAYQAFANCIGVKAREDLARNPNMISGAQANAPRTPTAG